MTEKTANQIANMKKQTIGVEVEMNGITRQNAARIATGFFAGNGNSSAIAVFTATMTKSAN